MLKSRAVKPASNHQEVFLQRYKRLMDAALRLTQGDREQAKDLVHDVFVHFTLDQPYLDHVRNLDGYLYCMLRNMHISQIRRTTRIRALTVSEAENSIADYDFIAEGLAAVEQRAQQVHEELCLVCQYACARKETSKAGSVLILRFFHGYYPDEIARVLHSARTSVDKWLQISRTEAKLYLSDKNALGFIGGDVTEVSIPDSAQTAEELVSELRNVIFSPAKSDCLTGEELQALYFSKESASVDCQVLGHMVSCRKCLDEVNALLELPLLSERYPIKMLARNKRKDKDGGSGSGGASGGEGGATGGDDFISKSQRRLKKTIEHRPQQLRISVNGFILGSQDVSAKLNKQTISVKGEEKIGFVEIFSEQEVRLLFSNVEPPPDGPVEYRKRVELSDQRSLELALDFSESWPNLNVTYHDPTFSTVESIAEVPSPASQRAARGTSSTPDEVKSPKPKVQRKPARHTGLIERVRVAATSAITKAKDNGRSILDLGLLLRPGTITAVLALLLVAATFTLLLHRAPIGPNHALEVLSQATAAEQTRAAQTNQVLHRTFYIEEWTSNQLRSRQRIEMWQKGGTEVAARRVYDTDGRLQNGEWRRADGMRLLFNHGAKLRNAPAREAGAAINSTEIWRLTPSAEEFKALISSHGDPSQAQIEERPTSYTLYFTDTSASSGLIETRLAINRSDLRAVGQTFVIREGTETVEYRFTEAAYEHKSVSDVAPSVFEPDPALLSGATKVTAPLEPLKNENAKAPLAATAPVASLELEVEVLRMLNQVNALSGEQIALTRTPAGYLRVQGIVDTEERKAEIFRALGSVKNDPAVRVEIETAAVAAARQKSSGNTGTISLDSVAIQMDQAMPVGADLRRYLAQKGISSEQTEAEMKHFANQAQARARQMRRQALALKQLAEHFSAEDLRQMDAARREEWKGLLRERAQSVASEAETLTQQLEAIFPNSRVSADGSLQINSEADFATAARKVWERATACDTAVNQSFSIYSTGEQTAAIKTHMFWKNLADVAQLAAQIQRAH